MAWLGERDTGAEGSSSRCPGKLHLDKMMERERHFSFGFDDVRIDDTC
jgi:hypothetical protein